MAEHTKSEPRTVKNEIAYILGRIEGFTVYLRSGGPDPMDLHDLSDRLTEACDLATEAGNLLATFSEPSSHAVVSRNPVVWLETFRDGNGLVERMIRYSEPKPDESTISIEPLGVIVATSSSTDAVREALRLGLDAVNESFEYVKTQDDLLIAQARHEAITAALATAKPTGVGGVDVEKEG